MQACFVICQLCGKHGRIIKSDGFAGIEVCSQQRALHMVMTGVERGLITPDEAQLLTSAIEASGLPVQERDVDLLLLYQMEFYSALTLQKFGFLSNGNLAHVFSLQCGLTREDIPDDLLDIIERGLAKAVS